MQPMPSETQPLCSVAAGAASGRMSSLCKCLFLNMCKHFNALIENNHLSSVAVFNIWFKIENTFSFLM